MKNVYALPGTEVLDIAISDRFKRTVNVGEVKLSANEYGEGRGVYIAGLPYSAENARMLLRAMFWAAHKEGEMKKAFADNVYVDCTYYPDSAKYALINNTNEVQRTRFFDRDGIERTVEMKPDEIVWISISEGE